MSSSTHLIRNATVIAGDSVVPGGWLLIENGKITDLGVKGAEPSGVQQTVDLLGNYLLPGFVDVHVHGGGGQSFGADPEANAAVSRFHAAGGTTSLLAGITTAPKPVMIDGATVLGSAVDVEGGARILGLHLEGPFISLTRKGAHNPSQIRPPDAQELSSLNSAAQGKVRLVTAAPEIHGFDDLLREATLETVLIGAGHTDATGEQLLSAIDAGVKSLTHTFNGMRPVSHRSPAVLQAIVDSDVMCEIICDGLHVHPTFVRMLRQLVGPERVVLITDAVAWAGLGDGEYSSGERRVEVVGGRVVLVGTETLAGSTLTMAEAFRLYVQFTGASICEASKAASTNPARLLGEDSRIGTIRVGLDADLVVLDKDLACVGVMGRGEWFPAFDVDKLVPAHSDIGDVAQCPCNGETTL
ncbi:MAG TPA: N-acetylglucosamine-6-phosphate deacetylase [Acidimicrobiales bacterium]